MSSTEDPLDILKAAGVECPEVVIWDEWHHKHTQNRKLPDAAILALCVVIAGQGRELFALRCVYRELTGKDWNWSDEVRDD